MNNILNIVNNLTNSDAIFLIIVITLVAISAFMFYLIYSQNKQVVSGLKTLDNSQKDQLTKEKEEAIVNNEISENTQELASLQTVSKELEELAKNKQAEMTSYEAEQEEKAIISYDELLEKSSNVSISYSDTTTSDDILVKKVDLSNTGKIDLDPIKKELNSKVSITNYEHEEEFLKALKQLQNLLN